MRRPLSVVATDQEALKALLSLHAPPEPRILDCTFNRGRMWKGLAYRPHRLDRDPALFESGYTDTVADFRALPFGPGEFDVIVFDPPHLSDNAGAFEAYRLDTSRGTPWTDRFGTAAADLAGEDVSDLFAPFLTEARRVLTPRTGVVLAKISDQDHRGRQRLQHVDLANTAREAGFTVCDLIVKVSWNRANMDDPKWEHIYHCRAVHCFWFVLRNGRSCRSPYAPRVTRWSAESLFSEAPA